MLPIFPGAVTEQDRVWCYQEITADLRCGWRHPCTQLGTASGLLVPGDREEYIQHACIEHSLELATVPVSTQYAKLRKLSNPDSGLI